MTEESSTPPDAAIDDQREYPFGYDRGRMPLFMKLIWIGFLVLATWYVVANLLVSLGKELQG